MLDGIGYTVGYQWNANMPISYKVEMGMITAFRERKINETIGDIRYLDLYYNLAQMNVAFIPTWNFISTKRLGLSAGIGLSCAYQSKVYTSSHYEYKIYTDADYWENVMKVDATNGLCAGLVGALDLNYQLSAKWIITLSTQYQIYYQGESALVTGIGVGLKF